jgi:uncharacterized membrane protein YfcA
LLAGYVVGLRLPRETFIKTISMVYVCAAVFLLVGGVTHGYATPLLLLISTVGMVPVYFGMRVGARIRHRIDPEKFRILVLGAVWLTGANMIRLGLGY